MSDQERGKVNQTRPKFKKPATRLYSNWIQYQKAYLPCTQMMQMKIRIKSTGARDNMGPEANRPLKERKGGSTEYKSKNGYSVDIVICYSIKRKTFMQVRPLKS